MEQQLVQYDEAIKSSPLDQNNYLYKGSLLLQLNRLKEAELCFKKALELGQHISALQGLGFIYLVNANYTQSLSYFEESLKINPKDENSLASKGSCLLGLRKFEDAINCFKEVLKYNPSNKYAFNGIGSAYSNMNNFNEGVIWFEKTLKIISNDLDALTGKSICLLNLNRYDECINCSNILLSINSSDCFFLVLKGNCLYSLGKYEESYKIFLFAKEILNKNVTGNTNPQNIDYVRNNIQQFINSSETMMKMNQQVQSIENNCSPEDRKKLNIYKEEILKINENESRILKDITSNNLSENEKNRINQENEERIKRLEEMIKELSSNLQKNFEDDDIRANQFKSELDNKLDNYNTIIKKKISELNISDNKRSNITDYYNAFLNSFSAAYTNAQVIESGQVVIDKGHVATDILSKCLSFIPVVGDFASDNINSIGEFIVGMDIKRNARKFRNLFSSPVQLEQIIGKAFITTIDSEEYIVNLIINHKDEDSIYLNYLNKLKIKFNEFNEMIDDQLYGKKYINESYRLGIEDGNQVISFISSEETINDRNIDIELERVWKGIFSEKNKKLTMKHVNEKEKAFCSCTCTLI